MLPHDSMSVCEKIVTDLCSRIDHDVCQQHGVPTDLYILTDHDVWTNVGVFSNLGGRMNYRCGVDARRIFLPLIEKFNRPCKFGIWVSAAQHCARNVLKRV